MRLLLSGSVVNDGVTVEFSFCLHSVHLHCSLHLTVLVLILSCGVETFFSHWLCKCETFSSDDSSLKLHLVESRAAMISWLINLSINRKIIDKLFVIFHGGKMQFLVFWICKRHHVKLNLWSLNYQHKIIKYFIVNLMKLTFYRLND